MLHQVSIKLKRHGRTAAVPLRTLSAVRCRRRTSCPGAA
jgi:hypothetical protein